MTTAGDVEENAKLMDLVDQHERNTDGQTETVVADMQYGTVDNFRACQQRGLNSHMADLSLSGANKPQKQGIFGLEQFLYDAKSDTYCCPAGQTLTRRKHKKQRQAYEYACAASTCQACAMRPQCTRAKGTARTIKRHYDQEAIDAAREQSHSRAAKRDRRRRKWRMEGSFGDAATHHGFKRARWRRLWRQRIQDLLIATVQNLRTLLRHAGRRTRGACLQAPGHTAPAVPTRMTLLDTLGGVLLAFLKLLRRTHWPRGVPVAHGVCRPRPSLPDRFGQQPVELGIIRSIDGMYRAANGRGTLVDGRRGPSVYEPPTKKRRGGSGGEIGGLAHSGFRSLRMNRLFQGLGRGGSCPER